MIHRPFIDHDKLEVVYPEMNSGSTIASEKEGNKGGNLYFEFRGIPLLKNSIGDIYQLKEYGSKDVLGEIDLDDFLEEYGARKYENIAKDFSPDDNNNKELI